MLPKQKPRLSQQEGRGRPEASVHPQSKQRLCPSQILLFRVWFLCCATQCHQEPVGSFPSPASPGSAWPTTSEPHPSPAPNPHKGDSAKRGELLSQLSRQRSSASAHGMRGPMEFTSCTLELVSPDFDLAGSLRRCEAAVPHGFRSAAELHSICGAGR